LKINLKHWHEGLQAPQVIEGMVHTAQGQGRRQTAGRLPSKVGTIFMPPEAMLFFAAILIACCLGYCGSSSGSSSSRLTWEQLSDSHVDKLVGTPQVHYSNSRTATSDTTGRRLKEAALSEVKRALQVPAQGFQCSSLGIDGNYYTVMTLPKSNTMQCAK
jgi:hypothetical protein